jgi:hypothetical protein
MMNGFLELGMAEKKIPKENVNNRVRKMHQGSKQKPKQVEVHKDAKLSRRPMN